MLKRVDGMVAAHPFLRGLVLMPDPALIAYHDAPVVEGIVKALHAKAPAGTR